MRRSTTNRWIAGVCGGIAEASGIPAWIIRLLYVIFTISSLGATGILIYIVAAVLMGKR